MWSGGECLDALVCVGVRFFCIAGCDTCISIYILVDNMSFIFPLPS